MRTFMAAVLGSLASALCSHAQVDPLAARATWEQKAEQLHATSQAEFQAGIRGIDRPPHARGEYSCVGGSVYRPSWSGTALQVDADWWIVREAAAATNVNPPPPGIPVKTHVVGLPDLRAGIEPALYEAVRLIHRSPSANDREFDPVNLIRAVNFLHAFGEERAVAALREYVRLCSSNPALVWHQLDADRVILLCRLLYVAPPGVVARAPRLGGPWICVQQATASGALFPIAIQDDVPFLISGGYMLGGLPEDPTCYMEYCRTTGGFRKRPMAPSTDPFAAAAKVLDQAQRDLCPADMVGQKHRLLDLVRPQALVASGAAAPGVVAEAEWAAATAAAIERGLRWDVETQDFVASK